MSQFQSLLDILSGAGDVGIYVVAYILWKFDRRLLRLEASLAERAKINAAKPAP